MANSMRIRLTTALVAGVLSGQIVSAPSFAEVTRTVSDSGIGIQRQSNGIRAVLADQPGDYYLRPDGSKISLRRKQGVFALEADELDRQQIEQSLKSRFGDQVERVNAKNLGNRLVVRMRPAAGQSKNGVGSLKRGDRSSLQIDEETALKSMLPVASRASQVFANARGEGDLVLLPRITLKLHSNVAPAKVDLIARRYGLSIDRKLKVPGQVYSLKIKNTRLSATAQFALVRVLAAHQEVKWAEPQFIAKPFKTQFIPNDQFLSEQWHLRDRGFRGSRCDTDCDATDAWDLGNANGVGAVSGDGMVIAIVDDGVQLDHPDLQSNIWVNTAEQNGTPNVDDDLNGYVDDINGWDFVVDSSSNPNLQNSAFAGGGTCSIGVDSTAGPDNDPSPQVTTNCFTINGDAVEQDNHGTAVAGLAAAAGGNSIGVAGTAYRANILPIRAISDFDTANGVSFCVNIAEAIAYAGRHADVINNSWGMNDDCMALEDVIADVVSGQLMDSGDNNISKRPNLGSPVLFASGNSASGWVRISVPVGVGEKAYEWRFLRSAFPDDFDVSAEDNSAWLDEIRFPGGQTEGFEGTLGAFQSGIALNNRCDAECTSFINPARPTWAIETDAERVFLGSQSAVIDTTASDCGNSYLSVLRDDPAGEISFWVWVSSNLETGSDKFEFLVNGVERVSYGDIAQFIDNAVGYPANLSTTIAVGASNSGDLSGATTPNKLNERRAFYSQFGASLDLVAPSGDQHLGIATTDRTGSSDGYNLGQGSGELSNSDYTNSFGGTSASAPIAAGVAAAVIALDTDATAAQVRGYLQDSADKIGRQVYDSSGSGRNDQYGFGRLNMLRALQLASGTSLTDPSASCAPDSFDYDREDDATFALLSPLSQQFCPALGELPLSDDFCIPIKAANNNVAVICI